MKLINKILLGIILISSIGCASNRKTEFTQEIRSRLERNNIDITKLQYYISKQLILAREVTNDTTSIKKGTVIFQNGKYYETITLPSNTPGVCLMAYPNKLNVSFENEAEKFLQFDAPNYNLYQVATNDVLSYNPNVVIYNGVQYALNYKGSAPVLLINKNIVNNVNRVNKRMKGRKVE